MAEPQPPSRQGLRADHCLGYGIAASLLMVITTLLAALIARQWGYALPLVIAVNGAFLIVDLGFFGANSVKLLQGGWFPLAIAAVISMLMLTWRRGQQLLDVSRERMRQSWAEFGAALRMAPPMRTRGAAAFLALSVDAVPIPLSRSFALTGAIPENVLLVAVESLEIPTVLPEDHIEVIPEDNGLRRVILRYGFTDLISVPKALSFAVEQGKLKPADLDGRVVYSGSETVIPSRTVPGMVFWREALFGFMHRNAERSAAYFCIPPDRVIDVGTEIEI